MLYGAATAQEKRTEIERALGLCADLGLRSEPIDSLVSAARSEAYSQARADRRDLDRWTLWYALTKKINTEALVQGCEANGLPEGEGPAPGGVQPPAVLLISSA